MKASVIDLGYNSLKMVSYDIRSDGSFVAFDRMGSLTMLGQGLPETGFLSEEAMGRSIRQLRSFEEANKLMGVTGVIPIATSAVREAGNKAEFLKWARAETGLEFRVLSGAEEALFSYVGAARACRVSETVFFDLGGGSLELIHSKGLRVRRILSLPLGALRTTELYAREGKRFAEKEYGRMRRRINDLLPTREELGLEPEAALVGIGGTVRALARYDQRSRNYPLNKLHSYVIKRRSVLSIHKKLRKVAPQKIARVEQFGRARAESITAGSLVVAMLMERLQMKEVIVSTHGLRDGVLTEFVHDPSPQGKVPLTVARANDLVGARFLRRPEPSELADALLLGGVVSREEGETLSEASRFLDLSLSTGPEMLFYSILSQDSPLDHASQIALALSMVRLKSAKAADWFRLRYESLLDERSGLSVSKMAAIISIMRLLRSTGSAVALKKKRKGRRSLLLEITTPSRDFPLLFREASREVERVLGLRMSLTRGVRRVDGDASKVVVGGE